MIHAITGLPGGGKSLHAMALLVQALRQDELCQVVTNIPVDVVELNVLMHRRYPGENLRVCERVTVIGDDEVRDFFRRRGNVLGDEGDDRSVRRVNVVEEWESGEHERVRYSTSHPVVYFLDEFHLAYNAREWKSVGKGALWYASQHRKRGDTVYWISQFSDNVDKQFRVLTQDWTTVRNWSNERWFNLGKPPAKFQWSTSLEPPNVRSRNKSAWGIHAMDKPLADCYRTMQGTGIAGTLAPDRIKPTGIPVVWLGLGAGVALLCLVVGVPLLLGEVIGMGARAVVGVSSSAIPASLVPEGPSLRAAEVAPSAGQSSDLRPVEAPEKFSESLRVTAVCPVAGGYLVGLSDGRVLRSNRDRELRWIAVGERRVQIGEQVLSWGQ